MLGRAEQSDPTSMHNVANWHGIEAERSKVPQKQYGTPQCDPRIEAESSHSRALKRPGEFHMWGWLVRDTATNLKPQTHSKMSSLSGKVSSLSRKVSSLSRALESEHLFLRKSTKVAKGPHIVAERSTTTPKLRQNGTKRSQINAGRSKPTPKPCRTRQERRQNRAERCQRTPAIFPKQHLAVGDH